MDRESALKQARTGVGRQVRGGRDAAQDRKDEAYERYD
jgi:hypothetical protein